MPHTHSESCCKAASLHAIGGRSRKESKINSPLHVCFCTHVLVGKVPHSAPPALSDLPYYNQL
jgi:hypothetical protein